MRAEEFGDLWFVDHVDVHVEDKLWQILVITDAMSNLLWAGPHPAAPVQVVTPGGAPYGRVAAGLDSFAAGAMPTGIDPRMQHAIAGLSGIFADKYTIVLFDFILYILFM